MDKQDQQQDKQQQDKQQKLQKRDRAAREAAAEREDRSGTPADPAAARGQAARAPEATARTAAEAAVRPAPRAATTPEGHGEGRRESRAETAEGRQPRGQGLAGATERQAGVAQPPRRRARDRQGRSGQAQAGHAAEDVVADGRPARGDAAREAEEQQGSAGSVQPQGKNQDFSQRARGGQGQGGQSWKPGQNGQGQSGQGQQNGQNGQNGQGSGNGGNDWGVGHDDNLTGDPTQTSGNDKDQELQGQSSSDGGSTRETILAAAQKGFAGVGYKNVYVKYERVDRGRDAHREATEQLQVLREALLREDPSEHGRRYPDQ